MKELIIILDELLVAYESATAMIDQDLVKRVLQTQEHLKRLQDVYPGLKGINR